MSWKQLSSEEKYRSPWMRVTEDKVETDFGKQLTWSVVHQNPCALVIPWNGERFGLVGMYRYAIGRYSWEFPSGGVSDESIESAAARELHEEAGLSAETLKKIGFFSLASGSSDQVMTAFIATGLSDIGKKPDDAEEGIEIKWVTYAELCSMITAGEIVDGPTLSAIACLTILKPGFSFST